jgi:deoxyguanosine kinase
MNGLLRSFQPEIRRQWYEKVTTGATNCTFFLHLHQNRIMHICYLSLGSNLGNREEHLENARRMLQEQGLVFLAVSPLYQTEPWGFETSMYFLNQVIKAGSDISAGELFRIITDVENCLGRVRSDGGAYENRVIDIDILFYDDMILNSTQLEVPHPRIAERRFILEPLASISPEMVHPLLKKTIRDLLDECNDKGLVKIFIPDSQKH